MDAYAAGLGDRIMVLEGFFSNPNEPPAVPTTSPPVDPLEKITPADIIEASKAPKSESAIFIKERLRAKSRALDILAAQKHKVALKAAKNYKNARGLTVRLMRIAGSKMKKAQSASAPEKKRIQKELSAIARRLVIISERAYGYERLNSLSSALSAHAKIGSILTTQLARAIDLGRPDYIKNLLRAVRQVNRVLDKKLFGIARKTKRIEKKRNELARTLSKATSAGMSGLGDIFEDFGELFSQLFDQIASIGDDIVEAFHELTCPACNLMSQEWFGTSVKAVAMAYGGPTAVAKAEEGMKEAGKYGDCEKACVTAINKFAKKMEKVKPLLMGEAVKVVELFYREDENIILYRQKLVDLIRGKIIDFLIKEHKIKEKNARMVAEGVVSVDSMNEIFNRWAKLHKFKRGLKQALNALPLFRFSPGRNQWKTVPGTMGHRQVPAVPKAQFAKFAFTDGIDLYGWCLKHIPGFVNMSKKQKWQQMRGKADAENHAYRKKDKSKNAQHHFILRNRSINFQLGSVSGGDWKKPETLRATNPFSYGKVSKFEKTWYKWVPEGKKEAEAAAAFVAKKIADAKAQISPIQDAARKLDSYINRLKKNPGDRRLQKKLGDGVALAKALVPLLKAMAVDVAQYDPETSDRLNKEIKGLELRISWGEQTLLVILAGQIQNSRNRLRTMFRSQRRIGDEIIKHIKDFRRAVEKNPADETSKQMLQKLVEVAFDLKNRVLADYRKQAINLKATKLTNSIELYMVKIGEWASKGKAALSKAKATGPVPPKSAALVAAAVAVPILLLI